MSPAPLRITIVLGAFFPVPPILGGAVEKFWFAVGQEFARRGHHVVQISRRFRGFPEREEIAGVQHSRVRGFETPASIWRLKLLDLIYSLGVRRVLPPADILVTNTFWLPFLMRTERCGKVYVHVARVPKGQMRFYSHAARLQALSSAVSNSIKTEAPALAARTRVIPYATRQAATEPEPISEREHILLFVGRVHPEKGVHLLVEAFTREMSSALVGWKLMIIGPTPTEQGGGGAPYLARLKDLAGGTDRIEFRGPIFEADPLEREIQRARIFVYPSLAERGETFGLAALEAMSAGCAVVVSDLACFHDFIADEQTGFIFNHRATDPVESLQATLRNLSSDPELVSRVAVAGRQKSTEYSIENVATQFLNDFEEVIREHA
ncbi:MAG: glycosyltransferase family 4 protein [Chthoniobacterales bacterium]